MPVRGRPRRPVPVLALAVALLLTGCGGGGTPSPAHARSTPSTATPSTSTGTPSSTPTTPTSADPVVREVPPAQWQAIVEAGMWRKGCPTSREDLRRLEVSYVSFSGDVRRGVLVVNRDVADSLGRIFTRLFEARFPIRRMRPVEHYDGDSDASLRDDNTSVFNCRRPDQINAPPTESPHANGRAIDINPRENPWKDLRCRCWSPGARFHARTPGPGKILRGGLVWRAFRAEGWVWQDIDVPDYMHFDTGYPSTAFTPTGTPAPSPSGTTTPSVTTTPTR